MNLTEHFTLEEMTRSNTAALHKIDNTPNAQQIANLKNLCEQVLEPLRQYVGAPIHINSGFRNVVLNRLVGGVSNSQHLCQGTSAAADLDIENPQQGREWIIWIEENVNFDQVFLEKNARGHYWVHVSCCSDLRRNRHQVLKLQIKERR